MIATPSPLRLLIDELGSTINRADLEKLLSLVRVPPDLRYLRDGLNRTSEAISYLQEEYDRCRPSHSLSPQEILRGIDELLECINEFDWDPEDPRLAVMGRNSAADKHPLQGHGLTVIHHWANLFYTHDQSSWAHSHQTGAFRFEELMYEFSSFVLAGQARTSPSTYLAHADDWWSNKKLPASPKLDAPTALQSRLQVASRAMRRLTLSERHSFFVNLSDTDKGRLFSERVYSLLKNGEDDHELNDIALLIEWIDPSWHRPNREARERPESSGPRSVRRKARDGYVRIAGTNVVVSKKETGDGETVETYGVETDEDEPTPEGSEPDDWSPFEDNLGDDVIEAALSDKPVSVDSYSYRSRLAQMHLQRSNLGLPQVYGDITKTELRGLAALVQADFGPHPEPWLLMAMLVAGFATGRSIHESRTIRIKRSIAPDTPINCIHYIRDETNWLIPIPPPAWTDRDVETWAEPIEVFIALPDVVGFHRIADWLLSYSSETQKPLKPNGQLAIGRVTSQRLNFLKDRLTKACGDHISLHAISRWLFRRLLTISKGDIATPASITGVNWAHSSSALHYSAYIQATLQNAYRESFQPFSKLLLNSTLPEQYGSTEDSKHSGALRVPTQTAVQDWLQRRRDGVNSDLDYPTRHNNFVAYVLAGLVLGIGMRPFAHPHFRDWSPDACLLTFDEKSRGDYHRRFSFVPAQPLEQLSHYVRSWSVQQGQFPVGHKLHKSPFPILIEGNWQAMRPIDVITSIGEPEMELYALRRFARTQLLKRGASGEDVDAWMGHWVDRCSPHDDLSAYPMSRLAKMTTEFVEPLLQDIGFHAVQPPA